MPDSIAPGIQLYRETVYLAGSGLLWTRFALGQREDHPQATPCDYPQALEHAFTARIGGDAHWRLPTITEFTQLQSLIAVYPALAAVFTPTGRYWTGNTMNAVRSREEPAYYDTQYGSVSTQGRADMAYLRLVRKDGTN